MQNVMFLGSHVDQFIGGYAGQERGPTDVWGEGYLGIEQLQINYQLYSLQYLAPYSISTIFSEENTQEPNAIK